MLAKRTIFVYGFLGAAMVLSAAWQTFEHSRIRDSARTALLNRARDISNSVGVVIRSQGGRSGYVRQPRLKAALEALTESRELLSVAVLNAAGEVAVSAGEPVDLDVENLPESGERWTRDTVMFVNLVDFGPDGQDKEAARAGTIILPPRDTESGADPPSESSRPRGPRERPDGEGPGSLRSLEPGQPLNDEQTAAIGRLLADPPLDDETLQSLRAVQLGDVLTEDQVAAVHAMAISRRMGEHRRGEARRGEARRGGPPFRRPPFRRPPWIEEAEYQELLKKQGVHAFVLSMSTEAFRAECGRDLWLRMALAGIGLMAAIGLGFAWHNFERSAKLQMRLLRASEMNLHLQEMNVAAAGLAHETRNPLNIIRGLAQMIAKHRQATPDIRSTSSEIAEEVDRVTGRLNQFMDYSRPPEAKPAPTSLAAVIGDVARALESDREDKAIQFDVSGPDLSVEADESLLRQVLFNLLLNAVQVVEHGGKVAVRIARCNGNEATIEVHDTGPGVPEEARQDIFRPYYTTSEQGTGLGLAVVRQIALAHQWEIAYIPGTDGGAVFRLSGLKAT